MKKPLFVLLLLAPGLAHAQTSYPYALKGTIGQLNAPAKVYLVSGFQLMDSTTLKNGVFELKGTTAMPQSAELVLQRTGHLKGHGAGSPDRIRVYLEPGPVVLASADSLRNATVTGGPLTRDDHELDASLKPVFAKRRALRAELLKTPEQQRQTPEFKQRMQPQFEALDKEYVQCQAAFIKAHPNSWVSLNALMQMRMTAPQSVEETAPLYEALSPALKNTAPGRLYGDLVRGLKAVAIGATAPAFTLKTPAGQAVSLADYRGKYVLVDFWASWCGPCRAENPAVTRAYNAYKGRDFDILGVSLDDKKTREKWLKAIADDHLAWTQVSDLRGWQNAAAQRYGVQSIPQNFLIDPTGKIVAANLHGDELTAALARYLKSAAK